MVAAVDTIGMTQFGNALTWNPANGPARRAAAMKGRARAGTITYSNGNSVRGS